MCRNWQDDILVTHQSTTEGWIKRISRRRVRLFDVQLYVFCQTYRQHKQRRGNAGAFEIYFHSEEGEYFFLSYNYMNLLSSLSDDVYSLLSICRPFYSPDNHGPRKDAYALLTKVMALTTTGHWFLLFLIFFFYNE